MSDNNPEDRQAGGLNPQALRLEDLARILTVSGLRAATVEILDADLDAGAPRNRDGTINLVHYAAWLVKNVL
ncbi:MAG: hypothetical protein KKE86_10460 [Planctomycetes bacterium]|nr:hypothetical protein [Planctomycetota bacterium]MBU4399742.1 hypothetical protein [Planctomycetota bacterium]MCG2684798.1 hypothetical protein [Planctomycetales bacterium]